MQVNKDLDGFLRPLLKHADRLIAIDLPNTLEAYKPAEITAVAEAAGLESRTARSAADAVLTAVKGPRGRILVYGSLYLAGEFLAAHPQLIESRCLKRLIRGSGSICMVDVEN